MKMAIQQQVDMPQDVCNHATDQLFCTNIIQSANVLNEGSDCFGNQRKKPCFSNDVPPARGSKAEA
jgi:hypothetical protein